MPAGRPRKYNTKQVKEIGDTLEQYIDETRIPILAEFAYQNKIPRDVPPTRRTPGGLLIAP